MRGERELTARALLSGVLLGALLTPCNVYSGLKIGWSFNMSIVALLLGLGGWRLAERAAGAAALVAEGRQYLPDRGLLGRVDHLRRPGGADPGLYPDHRRTPRRACR